MALTTAQIQNLLRPGLAAIAGSYPAYPSEWSEIFDTYESDKAFELEEEMKFTGLAQLRGEGAPSAIDTMGQRFATVYLHRYVSLMFVMTRQSQKDNLYKQKFPMIAKAFRHSFDQSKEVLGAAILNNAFNAAFPIGDGQSLCSTAHPIDGNTVSNRAAVAGDLNEASLESALIQIALFKDIAGLIIKTIPQKLIVPPQLNYVAERLCGSQFRTNTPNNDISAVYNLGSLPQGYRVNHFLSSSTNWFIKTDAPDGFKHYQREPFETDSYIDFDTDNIKFKGLERYSFNVTNWRAVFGNGA